MATNNHQLVPMLLRYSKLSRWQQPPRVTRTLQPQRSPSATRCNHSSKCTRNYSRSHYDDELTMEMSERCLLRLTRMSSKSKCQESEPQAGHHLFIDVSKQIKPLEPERGALRTNRTRQSDAPEPASGRRSCATCPHFKYRSFDSNDHKLDRSCAK
jgi:hypothetical protein